MINRREMVGGALFAGAFLKTGDASARPAPVDAFESAVRAAIAAINDAGATPAALETFLSPAVIANRGPRAWLDEFARVRANSGGLEYVRIFSLPTEMLVVVRTREGGHERFLTASRSPDTPDRLANIFASPRPAPYPLDLVQRDLNRGALAKALADRVRWSANRDEFSGAVRVVAPDSTVVFETASGNNGMRAIRLGDRFHLGSADKSFTALMVARQIGSNALRFDTRLGEVLPDYPNTDAAATVTIEHLLSHRAGLGGLFDRPRWDRRMRYDRVAQLLPIFAAEPLAFQPGSRARYSNEGYVVLGAILERLGGRSYWNLLDAQIYRPAAMRHSAHLTATDIVADRVIGARYADDDVLGLKARIPAPDFTGWRGNSCGGGYSTVRDMCAYLAALRGGLLAPDTTVRRLTAVYPGGVRDYGMGFTVRERHGRRLIGHSGGGPRSGIDGDSAIVWETGWAYSVLGNYDAPFARNLANDIGTMLAAQAR